MMKACIAAAPRGHVDSPDRHAAADAEQHLVIADRAGRRIYGFHLKIEDLASALSNDIMRRGYCPETPASETE